MAEAEDSLAPGGDEGPADDAADAPGGDDVGLAGDEAGDPGASVELAEAAEAGETVEAGEAEAGEVGEAGEPGEAGEAGHGESLGELGEPGELGESFDAAGEAPGDLDPDAGEAGEAEVGGPGAPETATSEAGLLEDSGELQAGESLEVDGELGEAGELGHTESLTGEAGRDEGGTTPLPHGDMDDEDVHDLAATLDPADLADPELIRKANTSPHGGGEDGSEPSPSHLQAQASAGSLALDGEGPVDSAMIEAGASDEEARLSGEEYGGGEEEPEDDQPDPMQELQEKYEQLLELNERAIQHNVALQRRVIQRKVQDKSYDAAEKQTEGKVTEHKYQNVLHNVHAVRLKLRLQQVKAARMSEELKNQLEAKRQKAIECRDSFQEFKRQVARHAEYARTGKKIPEKIIQEVEEFELDKDAEVEEVRGSNISLKNRLAKLEQALRKKDELAENLHVIDFEQLKIENQTLNEKIEERNEELHKLRKKTIVTVQIITHMREKVQFVQQEYQVLKAELAQLDQDLAAQRDLVAKTKHERDEHRTEYGKLRQQTGIFNSEHLARDFEARAESIKQLKEDIAQLKKRHAQMTQFIKRSGGTA